jgi:hypothetical protein
MTRTLSFFVGTQHGKRIKKKAGKPRQKGPSLSDWLAAQQNEGRRG